MSVGSCLDSSFRANGPDISRTRRCPGPFARNDKSRWLTIAAPADPAGRDDAASRTGKELERLRQRLHQFDQRPLILDDDQRTRLRPQRRKEGAALIGAKRGDVV